MNRYMKNKSKYPPIFLSSTDSYSDIWDLFFSLFKKNWPEYDGVIYLNTQEKEIKVDGLNIICTKLGHLGSFGKEVRACLDLINEDIVMLMLIDFIFMGKVKDEKIREYLDFFKSNDVDTLNFMNYSGGIRNNTKNADLEFVRPPAPHVFFNYQIAFWKKSVLYQMVLPWENPWTSEWFGTKRAERMNIKEILVKKDVGSPIKYHPSGCLSKAKWHPEAVSFIKKEHIDINMDKRGYIDLTTKRSLKKRLKIKKMIIESGLKGSYMDLLKRKYIH